MAIGTAAAIAGGVGLLGGAIAGGQDQTTTTTRNVAPPSARERELQEQSMQSYLQQLALAQQAEAGIQGGAGVQGASRQALESILSGQGFGMTPEEQARVEALRQAQVAAGSDDINRLVNEQLQAARASAGQRGVRGQALSELEGRAISGGAREISNLAQQANITAAQQAMQLPQQRLQLQGSLANQNANFMEQLRQQAIQNRQMLQNPVLMQSLQGERLAAAGATQTTPGSLGGAIGGALGGAGALLGGVGSIMNAEKKAQGGRVGSDRDPTRRKEIEDFARGARQGGSWHEAYENIRNAVMGVERPRVKMADGGFVPGMERFPGDTMLNDSVPVDLSPGELVIPKSFAKDPKLAKAFVDYQFRQEALGGSNGST